jgi:hypothetical protein
MNRGLIALVLISLLALLIIGCKASAPGAPIGAPTGTGNNEIPATGGNTGAGATGTPAETSITGDIQKVDTTNAELNSSDIQNTGSLINEVNW